MGEHNFEQNPVILYGFALFMNAVSYFLVKLIIKNEGNNSHFAKAIGNDLKGKLSVVFLHFRNNILVHSFRIWDFILCNCSIYVVNSG